MYQKKLPTYIKSPPKNVLSYTFMSCIRSIFSAYLPKLRSCNLHTIVGLCPVLRISGNIYDAKPNISVEKM